MGRVKASASKQGEGANPIEVAAEVYADAILQGYTSGEAYKLAHPKCGKSGNALRVRACEFAKRPVVAEAIRVRMEEMREKASVFRERLVGNLIDEVDSCYRENRTHEPVMDQVKVLTKVLGMEKQVVDVNAKVGALDPASAADKINFLARQSARLEESSAKTAKEIGQ